MKNSFLIVLLLVAACGGTDFKKVEKLDQFRILAVVTTNPEVVPGAGVTLQLYVSDVAGGGRTISGTTMACIDPGISLGAEVNCDHDPSAVADTYDIDTTAGDMGSANLFTGLASDTLSVTVPVSILAGRTAREQINGMGYIVIFNFEVEGRTISIFKRIIASSKVTLNTNPSGSAILLNGIPIGNAPDDEDILRVTSNAPESYDFINVDGDLETRTEELQAAWFVTQGEVDKPKSDVNENVKYLSNAATIPSVIVSIVRDERGGVEIVREVLP
ncbi:MAG: hypothetical protein H0V66_00075 [Bdellovibrionales bacterium]|nr:hypothetical protein [Bdellovibrionales bacterium]